MLRRRCRRGGILARSPVLPPTSEQRRNQLTRNLRTTEVFCVLASRPLSAARSVATGAPSSRAGVPVRPPAVTSLANSLNRSKLLARTWTLKFSCAKAVFRLSRPTHQLRHRVIPFAHYRVMGVASAQPPLDSKSIAPQRLCQYVFNPKSLTNGEKDFHRLYFPDLTSKNVAAGSSLQSGITAVH